MFTPTLFSKFSIRCSQVRLLLALASAIGLTLGSTSFTYAQDIPTPTPPADGGEFEGAPDPTPGVEVILEPAEPDSIEPAVDTSTPTAPLPDSPAEVLEESTDPSPLEETTDIPGITDSADIVPASPTGETATDETAETVETPSTDNPSVGDPSEAGTPQPGDQPATGSTAPANNSPRGLW